jgi:hypothetical protein
MSSEYIQRLKLILETELQNLSEARRLGRVDDIQLFEDEVRLVRRELEVAERDERLTRNMGTNIARQAPQAPQAPRAPRAPQVPQAPRAVANELVLFKRHLVNLARTYSNTEAGTPEEIMFKEELDENVRILLQLGMSEAEIRRLLIEAQAPIDNRIPPFATRRYVTPTEIGEIAAERAEARALAAREVASLSIPAATKFPDYLNMEDEDIDSKNLEQLQELLACPICKGNIKDVRLSPCGHMMCKTCVKIYLESGNRKCPVCAQPFTNFDKVYYGKYLKYKMKYFSLKNKKN